VFKLTSCVIAASLVLAAHASADDALGGAALEFHHVPTVDRPIIALQMDAEAPDDLETYAEASGSTFGLADTWRLNFQAGGGFAVDEDKDTIFGFGGFGFSYFLLDNLSLELEFIGIGFDQPGEDAAGLGFNLLVRWHFIAQENWSLYVDGGAGMLGTTANVPPGTISFNFTPQAGVGATFEIADDTRLFVGVRLHHVSNANIGDQNFGLDNIMAYAGVSFPF
jgi:lipid A 3-O-deacylase